MSYAVSGALQTAIYDRLVTDVALAALVGDAIYDAVPSGPIAGTYVSLGPETAVDASDKTGRGAILRVMLSINSDAAGFAEAKAVAAAICDALEDVDLTLARGRLVFLRFERATARRDDAANGRRIDLRFAARVEDD